MSYDIRSNDKGIPLKNELLERVARKELRQEVASLGRPEDEFGSLEWELARHGGLWNYWREEDEFCDRMERRFSTPAGH